MDRRCASGRDTDTTGPRLRQRAGARRAWSTLLYPVLVVLLVSATVATNSWTLAGDLTNAETMRQWHMALSGWVHLGSKPTGATPGTFTTQQFIGADGQRMTYYLYLPAQVQPTRTYPVVLVLHGVGESAAAGNSPEQNRSLLSQQQYVQAWVTPAAQAQYPCFVVVPQVPTGTRWVDVPGSQGSYSQSSQPTAALKTAMDIVVTVEADYSSIDQHELYIVGISMGAYGVWDAIERWPSLFAAAAPLAGAGDPTRGADVAHVPIWDFQGASDTHALVTNSRDMYAAIHAEGGSSCLTEFPGVGHDLWNTIRVYQNATFRAWLFSQTSAPALAQPPLSCAGLSIDGAPSLGTQVVVRRDDGGTALLPPMRVHSQAL